MSRSIRILLQASIPYTEDDWHVGRFSLLQDELSKVAEVLARNRAPDGRGDDPILSKINRSDFDELWVLGVDGGTALSTRDCAAIAAFHKAGGGILTARDHQNMGMWLRRIDGVGAAHYFHDPAYCEPDSSRLSPDDRETTTISWPNYHSGSNGDLQRIIAVGLAHPLLRKPPPSTECIRFFPAHPHEGAVGVPKGEPRARTIARGKSLASGREFDLIVAFDRSAGAPGRRSRNRAFITSPITTGTSREGRRASSPKSRGPRFEANLERWMTFARTCAMPPSGWRRRVLRRRPRADERLGSACESRPRRAGE